MEKTTLVTLRGTFCYKVMPFGLKNVGATYQRVILTLFHDMMHKEMTWLLNLERERVMSKYWRNCLKDLRKYNLRLNPTRCSFGVKSGKLLEFVVSDKGIKVDPNKVKAIQSMPPPKTEKDVIRFLGRLNYIARYISQLTTTCDPIFDLLRKKNLGIWNKSVKKLSRKSSGNSWWRCVSSWGRKIRLVDYVLWWCCKRMW